MANNRGQRINEEVMRTLAECLRTIKDPRVHGLVSITRVEVTSDLSVAKVYVSILGDDNDKKGVMKGLISAAGYLRHELGSSMDLRHTPEIHFVNDESITRGAHILDIMEKLHKREGSGENDS